MIKCVYSVMLEVLEPILLIIIDIVMCIVNEYMRLPNYFKNMIVITACVLAGIGPIIYIASALLGVK